MEPTFRDGVFGLRSEGKSYREISDELRRRTGRDLSAKQVGSVLNHDYSKKPYTPHLEDGDLWTAIEDTIVGTYRLDSTYSTEGVLELIEELYGEKVRVSR